MTARRLFIPALLIAALGIPALPAAAQISQPAAAPVLLAGNAEGVWLVQPGQVDDKGENPGLRLYYRQLGKAQWKRIARNIAGEPSRAVAVGEDLFLLFAGGKCVRVDQAGESNLCHSLPGKLLGVCELHKVGRFHGPSLLAMVEVDASAPQLSTAPASESQPSSKPAAQPSVGLYLYAGEWTELARLPASMTTQAVRAMATSAGAIWMLTAEQDGEKLTRIYPLAAEGESSIPRAAIPGQPSTFIGLDGALAVLTADQPAAGASRPATFGANLSLYKIADGSQESYPVLADSEPVTWPVTAELHVTQLGEQLAMAWRAEGKLRFALTSRTGAMGPAEDLDEALATLPDTETAQLVIEYFLLSVVALTIITIFALRPRVGPKPFSLPEHMKTAHLIKRVLAALVDYLPFLMATTAILMPRMDLVEAETLFQDAKTLPPELAIRALYAWLVSVGLFSFYAFLMEYRYGATLGKMLLKLRAIGDDGLKLGLREALLRNLLKIIELSMFSSMQMMWFFGLIFLIPIITKYHQRLGDVIARTTVIDARSEAPPISAGSVTIGPLDPDEKPAPDDDAAEDRPDKPDSSA
jgi:uncharacterized RDD family membrane protein YckC